jgi:hypothetical protein
MTSNTLAMIQAYLDGGSGSTMEQIIMKQAYGDIIRLTAERDEMHRELRKAETESSMLRIECGVLEKNAEMTYENHQRIVKELTAERDEARRYSCDLEARIIMLEEDRRDTSNNFGTNPCSEIILPDYPLARDPKEIAKRKGWDCYKDESK